MSAFDPLRPPAWPVTLAPMRTIDADLLRQIALTSIQRVTLYKRDEITTDLICCDVDVGGQIWTFHEEMVGWDSLLLHLEKLPSFRKDWFAVVSQPPFDTSETVAFSRA